MVAGSGPCLLGHDWLSQLKLDWKTIAAVRADVSESKLDALLSRYADVFKDGLGTMTQFKASLRVKADTKPVFRRSRSTPFAIHEEVAKELDCLEQEGIIEKVETSDWAAPIVTVPKKDGKIRVCGDYKVTVNPHLQVDQYPLPKPDDLFASLAGGQKFTKLDLTHAYQQMCLEEESQQFLTVKTHKGLYRYRRLPYGVALAPAIFQRTMDTIYGKSQLTRLNTGLASLAN